MTADAVGGVWTYALELARGLASRRRRGHAGGARTRAGRGATRGGGADPRPLPQRHRAWPRVAGPGRPLDVAARQNAPGPGARVPPRSRPLQRLPRGRGGLSGTGAPGRPLLRRHLVAAVRGGALPPDWSGYAAGVRQGLAAADCRRCPQPTPSRPSLRRLGDEPARRPQRPRPCRLTATPKQPLILAAGRLWDEAKNIAALAAGRPGLPWPMLVAGERRCAMACADLGRLAAPSCTRRMAEAAIFAAPARYEPFGLAILEAAASGCALVLGDIPTLRELWDGAAMLRGTRPPGGAARHAAAPDRGPRPLREELQSAARERAQAYSRSAWSTAT